jgi:hypothetical protein
MGFGFDEVKASDLKMPLIYITQGLSKAVSDSGLSVGSIIENVSNTVLGNQKKPAQVIPFFVNKMYTVMKNHNGKKVFNSTIPMEKEEEFEQVVGNETFYYYPTMNFFVNVKGDQSGSQYVLSFRGSRNFNGAGRTMLTFLFQQYKAGRAPYEFVFDIGVKQVENDKGKWFVYTATPSKLDDKQVLASDAEKATAKQAAAEIEALYKKGHKIIVDETVLQEEVSETPF